MQHGIPVHMDGARILNAAVALGLSLKEVCKDVDSISVCFSKVFNNIIRCKLAIKLHALIADVPIALQRLIENN